MKISLPKFYEVILKQINFSHCWIKEKTTKKSSYQKENNHSDNDNITFPKKFEMKCIDLGSESTLGIVVVDRIKSFIIETKEDTGDNSYEALVWVPTQ